MKLNNEVHLVGSGKSGAWITHEYDSHVYLLDGGDALALIDAGVGLEPERILANVSDAGCDPKRITHILLTHCHADHCGGTPALRRETGAQAAMSREEVDFLRDGDEDSIGLTIARREGYYPSSYHLEALDMDIRLTGGEEIMVGDLRVRTIHVPGHSIGSICYLVTGKSGTHLFSGDVVFHKGEIGLLNCPGSSLADYRASIGKLGGLGVDGLFPGHGMFAATHGQWHIDLAIEAFKSLVAPRNAIR
ncbi:MAG: MBL fold metallo-hydrolase [Planctomycetes bacterium]|nr:MBL fold metallo-hydrolase [Planctomycetota bacterium]